jgi:hypothetical protein
MNNHSHHVNFNGEGTKQGTLLCTFLARHNNDSNTEFANKIIDIIIDELVLL